MFSLIKRPSVARAIIAANLSMLLFTAVAVAVLLMTLSLKVHGPVYERIMTSSDLTADILPPPLYLIETFLKVLQAKGAPRAYLKEKKLVASLDGPEKDFNERRNYWSGQNLPAEIRNSLDQKVIPDAQAIFDK